MNFSFLGSLQAAGALIGALADLAKQSSNLVAVLSKLPRAGAVSYENVSVDLLLDIRDPAGSTAVLERKQRVRFLASEAGTIRELIWGEGEPLAHYSTRGATRSAFRREGSKRVALLSLDHTPLRGETVPVVTRRVIRDGLLNRQEYLETLVERPTRRLAVKVLFPVMRPPRSASLATSPPGLRRSVPVRYRSDGRAFLSWRTSRPRPYSTYSLTWAW